jgi:hypothetical protein
MQMLDEREADFAEPGIRCFRNDFKHPIGNALGVNESHVPLPDASASI